MVFRWFYVDLAFFLQHCPRRRENADSAASKLQAYADCVRGGGGQIVGSCKHYLSASWSCSLWETTTWCLFLLAPRADSARRNAIIHVHRPGLEPLPSRSSNLSHTPANLIRLVPFEKKRLHGSRRQQCFANQFSLTALGIHMLNFMCSDTSG